MCGHSGALIFNLDPNTERRGQGRFETKAPARFRLFKTGARSEPAFVVGVF
jgi:hypothetical protein